MSFTANAPVLLLPLRIETRFVNTQLWIRVFPDDAHFHNFDARLTPEEQVDRNVYLASAKQVENWAVLVDKYGAFRASWLIQPEATSTVANENQALDPAFQFLPDQFEFYLYKKDDAGTETLFKKESALSIADERLLVIEEADNWLTDFEQAIQKGMGIKIEIEENDTFSKIIVTGIRTKQENELEQWIQAHQYSNGFSFLPYGTATNNVEGAKTQYSQMEEFDAATTFEYLMKEPNLLTLDNHESINIPVDGLVLQVDADLPSFAQQLGTALGVSPFQFNHSKNAGEHESEVTQLIQQTLWWVLGNYTLEQLGRESYTKEIQLQVWTYFSRYVRNRGAFSAIQIDDQPYGVLPVSRFGKIETPNGFSDQLQNLLHQIYEYWLEYIDEKDPKSKRFLLPRVSGEDNSDEELLQILTMGASSINYELRSLTPPLFNYPFDLVVDDTLDPKLADNFNEKVDEIITATAKSEVEGSLTEEKITDKCNLLIDEVVNPLAESTRDKVIIDMVQEIAQQIIDEESENEDDDPPPAPQPSAIVESTTLLVNETDLSDSVEQKIEDEVDRQINTHLNSFFSTKSISNIASERLEARVTLMTTEQIIRNVRNSEVRDIVEEQELSPELETKIFNATNFTEEEVEAKIQVEAAEELTNLLDVSAIREEIATELIAENRTSIVENTSIAVAPQIDTLFEQSVKDIFLKLPYKLSNLSFTLIYKLLGERFGILNEDTIATINSIYNTLDSLGETGTPTLEAILAAFAQNDHLFDKIQPLLDKNINEIETLLLEDTNLLNSPNPLYYSPLLELSSLRQDKVQTLIEDGSLLDDLLERVKAYKTRNLQAEKVYFSPSINDLRGAVLEIGLINEPFKITLEVTNGATVSKGQQIAIARREVDGNDSPITVPIIAQANGRITSIVVSNDEILIPGQELMQITVESDLLVSLDVYLDNLIAKIEELRVNPSTEIQKELQLALTQSIDLSTHRLDAWVTSLAHQNLDHWQQKNNGEQAYFGAYGWIENLSKNAHPVSDGKDVYDSKGGIIHAPNAAQASAAAIFKNAYLSQLKEDEDLSNPFTLHLSSDRIQRSMRLLQGMRENQQLGALLGYRVERILHDKSLDTAIYALRRQFPIDEERQTSETSKISASDITNVVDGLALSRAYSDASETNSENIFINNLPIAASERTGVKQAIETMLDTLDGSLDALMFEAGYQAMQGNLSQSAAAMEASKGVNTPPEIESLRTRTPGVSINHKIGLMMREVESFPLESNPRGAIEPALETWLKDHIGSLDKLGCRVEIYEENGGEILDTKNIKCSDLNLGYLDLLRMSDAPISDGAGELELRIWQQVRNTNPNLQNNLVYKITDQAAPLTSSLAEALEVLQYAKVLLGKANYLRSEDITTEGEEVQYASLMPLVDRLQAIVQKLKSEQAKVNAIITGIDFLEDTQAKIAQTFDQLKAQNLDFDFLCKCNVRSAANIFNPTAKIDIRNLKFSLDETIQTAEKNLADFEANPADGFAYYNAFDQLTTAAKAIFGRDFMLLPPAIASEKFKQSIAKDTQVRLVGDQEWEDGGIWGQERILNWLQGVAQVHSTTSSFEEWTMVHHSWREETDDNIHNLWHYRVAQMPTINTYPWTALSKSEIDTLKASPAYQNVELFDLGDDEYYPRASQSAVFQMGKTTNLDQAVFGLLIEEFMEHIPDEKMNTGVSFQYNVPNAEAPQALLLAVPDADLEEWTPEVLQEIVSQTLDLSKVRMLDLDVLDKVGVVEKQNEIALESFGFALPMTFLPFED